MAPDLNSVPPSPRPTTSSPRLTSTRSRRTSSHQQPAPTSPSLNILPSNQSAVLHTTSPPLSSPNMTSTTSITTNDNTGVGTGPGPLRHPRPLTAADLHLQLEKEQEAVVNRLTRELTLLRAAQNASVVSNTSSTSAGFPDQGDHGANHLLSGASHHGQPSQRREGHHRSSSSTSTRSISHGGSMAQGTSSGIADRTRERGTLPRHDSNTQTLPMAISLSRQNSERGSNRRSGASSPAPLSSAQSSYQPHIPGEHFPSYYTSSRPVPHRDPSSSSLAMMSGMGNREERGDSITSVHTSGRYEETAFHRSELENVKRENESLRRRVRELERTLRDRRQSDAGDGPRVRSESVSTTASLRERDGGVPLGSGVGRGRERVGTIERAERDAGAEEEGVRVGESARSAGL